MRGMCGRACRGRSGPGWPLTPGDEVVSPRAHRSLGRRWLVRTRWEPGNAWRGPAADGAARLTDRGTSGPSGRADHRAEQTIGPSRPSGRADRRAEQTVGTSGPSARADHRAERTVGTSGPSAERTVGPTAVVD